MKAGPVKANGPAGCEAVAGNADADAVADVGALAASHCCSADSTACTDPVSPLLLDDVPDAGPWPEPVEEDVDDTVVVGEPGIVVDVDDPGTVVDVDDPGTVVDVDDPGTVVDVDDPGMVVDVVEPGGVVDVVDAGTVDVVVGTGRDAVHDV